MRLETKRLILRTAGMKDVPAVLRYQKENREFHAAFGPLRPTSYFTKAFWKRRVIIAERERREDRSLRLYLFMKADPRRVVGNIVFDQISRGPFQSCVLGYTLNEAHQGQGLMSEALRAAIAYVFEEDKLASGRRCLFTVQLKKRGCIKKARV